MYTVGKESRRIERIENSNSFTKFASSLEKFDVWSKPYLSLDLETIFVLYNP